MVFMYFEISDKYIGEQRGLPMVQMLGSNTEYRLLVYCHFAICATGTSSNSLARGSKPQDANKLYRHGTQKELTIAYVVNHTHTYVYNVYYPNYYTENPNRRYSISHTCSSSWQPHLPKIFHRCAVQDTLATVLSIIPRRKKKTLSRVCLLIASDASKKKKHHKKIIRASQTFLLRLA